MFHDVSSEYFIQSVSTLLNWFMNSRFIFQWTVEEASARVQAKKALLGLLVIVVGLRFNIASTVGENELLPAKDQLKISP
jgi:hypothetical protein